MLTATLAVLIIGFLGVVSILAHINEKLDQIHRHQILEANKEIPPPDSLP